MIKPLYTWRVFDPSVFNGDCIEGRFGRILEDVRQLEKYKGKDLMPFRVTAEYTAIFPVSFEIVENLPPIKRRYLFRRSVDIPQFKTLVYLAEGHGMLAVNLYDQDIGEIARRHIEPYAERCGVQVQWIDGQKRKIYQGII